MTSMSVTPAARRSAPRLSTPSIILPIAILLILLRMPEILTTGRFWAEEGKIYFHDALLGSWFDALLAPRMGYFSAWNKLAALAAAAVPLEYAPLVTAYAALAVQLAVLWLALRSDAFPQPFGPVLAAAVILFAQPNGEIWLNTINSQFFLALGAALLLVTSPAALPPSLRLGFLALAGATGPVTAFLAPLFLWRAMRDPRRLFLAEAALVSLCALVQAWLVLDGLGGGARPAGFDPWALLATIGIKQLALPFLGPWSFGAANRLVAGSPAEQAVVVAALILLGIAVILALLAHPIARLLGIAAAGTAVLSITGALTSDPWTTVPPLAHGRYGYLPNALIGLGLVTVVLARGVAPWRRAAGGVLLAAFLMHGIKAWPNRACLQSGPDWRAELARWRADESREALEIWPPGWTMALPRSPETR